MSKQKTHAKQTAETAVIKADVPAVLANAMAIADIMAEQYTQYNERTQSDRCKKAGRIISMCVQALHDGNVHPDAHAKLVVRIVGVLGEVNDEVRRRISEHIVNDMFMTGGKVAKPGA